MAGNDFYSTKVGDVLRIVFPEGTRLGREDDPDWSEHPPFAADIFAFCAYLIQLNGLMGYYDPNPAAKTGYLGNEPLRVVLTSEDRATCHEASRAWREAPEKFPEPPKLVETLWKDIVAAAGDCIRVKKVQKDHKAAASEKMQSSPAWWRALFMLLVIADEACEGIGHFYAPGSPDAPVNNVPDLRLFDARIRDIRRREEEKRGAHMIRAEKDVVTLCGFADRHVVCVQPKGRVAQIGCSVRNLSRNLALTGPVGVVRCNWQQLVQNADTADLRRSLNILLIPMPWEINASAFHPTRHEGWGSFDIRQDWLPTQASGALWDEFYGRITAIIGEALKDTDNIDAIVFPEMALTYPIFKALFEAISRDDKSLLPRLQFMVAGSSNNCDKEVGNFVLTGIRENNLLPADAGKSRLIRVFSQRKHHRWKLNKDQIASYGLASALMPSIPWWENHCIESREINFFQFRRDAVFASLICEDLARSDPCHDIMRSVAPNLIFALLMDGPQLANRWPARYAGSLADDPGSTVITLTSNGLVQRSNHQFTDRKSHSVGLIRDGRGTTREIVLPPGHQAILLTLGTEQVVDHTIDGRQTTNSSEWYYISQTPIRAG
ncbi:hypothetical protein ATE68_01375 [Sphingopyxis sp. H038]|uniref:hypothetical protein n=1 Tax=unclassified Sphingopyxis TaxID=2614943 RepID=UPI0007313F38|nr:MULTISPECIES: hypothetical protein [unclassified Sphingopyxis]KTE04329.1 hypothetical protein ATE78_01375 [Sphingopyxis sp. H012]KTE10830.1 hypothetical protein ATE76_12965 [Sphingopyxis sp. H093]KTE13469.1 hypothetical protein ATE70_02050 [Sphingopyxis sp. H053]KTE25669.1 hypothetical protein ATE75_16325 [Sphingopyxis sp. H080]KTE36819.1 hypothetical protein ATE68_01375 [Sphingopyxis sp. H038]